MPNPETTLELVQFVERAAGELDDGSSPFRSDIEILVDMAHKAIVSGGAELDEEGQRPHVFAWAKSANNIPLKIVPKIASGTINATEDSTTITFSSNISQDLTDWFIRINEGDEVYRITAHTPGTNTATIDLGFIDSTVVGASYEAFKLRYTFGSSNILLPTGNIKVHRYKKMDKSFIDVRSKEALEEMYPLSKVKEEDPCIAGIVNFSDGNLTVQLNAYPKEALRMELPFIPIPADLTIGGNDPIVPAHKRVVIAELAAHYFLVNRDDDRATLHFNRAVRQFASLVNETSAFDEALNHEFGQLRPRTGIIDIIRERHDGFIDE